MSAILPDRRGGLAGGWRWALVATIAAADVAGFHLSGLAINARSLSFQLAVVGLMLGVAWFYSRVRRDDVIAAVCENLALLYGFVCAAQALDSILVANGGGFADDLLARLDAAVGLDWPQLFDFMRAHPLIARILGLAYGGEFYEVVGIPMLCLYLKNAEAPRELTTTFMLAALAAVLISGAVPALGAYVHYQVPGAEALDYVVQIKGLRDGTLREIDLAKLEGLVTFPSFHTALAILIIYVARALPWLARLPLVLLNLLIVASVPIHGGHHFIDMLGGLSVAGLAIAADRSLARYPAGWRTLPDALR